MFASCKFHWFTFLLGSFLSDFLLPQLTLFPLFHRSLYSQSQNPEKRGFWLLGHKLPDNWVLFSLKKTFPWKFAKVLSQKDLKINSVTGEPHYKKGAWFIFIETARSSCMDTTGACRQKRSSWTVSTLPSFHWIGENNLIKLKTRLSDGAEIQVRRCGHFRRFCECSLVCGVSSQGGGSDAERTKKKKRGDRYSVQTSLIVAALKKMLPIGLNMCSPADQELINLAKIRYSLVASLRGCSGRCSTSVLNCCSEWNKKSVLQRDTDEEVREFLQNNLHLQGKV